jgi:allantoicase
MSDTALAIRADEEKPDFAADAVNLASPRLGAGVIYVTDEFLHRANACSTMHRRCSTQTAMTNMANGWTAGKPDGGAAMKTYAASYNWARRE